MGEERPISSEVLNLHNRILYPSVRRRISASRRSRSSSHQMLAVMPNGST